MRKQAEFVKQVHTIYVVNNNNKLLGTMSLKRLLISNKETKVRDIINSNVIISFLKRPCLLQRITAALIKDSKLRNGRVVGRGVRKTIPECQNCT